VYASTHTVEDGPDWDGAYLESHVINSDGALLEGKPLKQDTLDALVDVFFDERKERVNFSGIYPESLLSFSEMYGGTYNMLWYSPAQIRPIFFNKGLHITSGKAWVPNVLFRVKQDTLYVFALADGTRPTNETALFHAPFHNVDERGAVCLGSAKAQKPKDKTFASLIKYWEDLFWLSEFSHLAGKFNPIKGNLNVTWNKLIADNSLTWETIDELKEMDQKKVKSLFS